MDEKPAIDCSEVGELRDRLIIKGHGLGTGVPSGEPGMELTETGRILEGIRGAIDAFVFKSTDIQALVGMLQSLPHVKSAEAEEDGTVTAVVETPVEIMTVRVPGWRTR